MTTVLVVDDEFLIAEVIAVSLEDMGFTVIQASNGKKALEVLEHKTPALVISDFMMPVMNGLELAISLKQNPLWAGLPIILMTGGHADQARLNPDLFNFILHKPFNIAALVNAVYEFAKPDQ